MTPRVRERTATAGCTINCNDAGGAAPRNSAFFACGDVVLFLACSWLGSCTCRPFRGERHDLWRVADGKRDGAKRPAACGRVGRHAQAKPARLNFQVRIVIRT